MQVRKASSASEPTDVPGIPNVASPPPSSRPIYLATVLPDLAPRPVIESAPIVCGFLLPPMRVQVTDPIPALRPRLLGFIKVQVKGATRTSGIA